MWGRRRGLYGDRKVLVMRTGRGWFGGRWGTWRVRGYVDIVLRGKGEEVGGYMAVFRILVGGVGYYLRFYSCKCSFSFNAFLFFVFYLLGFFFNFIVRVLFY